MISNSSSDPESKSLLVISSSDPTEILGLFSITGGSGGNKLCFTGFFSVIPSSVARTLLFLLVLHALKVTFFFFGAYPTRCVSWGSSP